MAKPRMARTVMVTATSSALVPQFSSGASRHPDRATLHTEVVLHVMPRPRFILFRARDAGPTPAVVHRALAALHHVVVRQLPSGWVVLDQGTGHEIEVTLTAGPLAVADIRALADNHWSDDPEGRAQIRAADARFELRYPDEDSAVNPMLVVQEALEQLTGGFGYDLEFNRITLAAEGEHRVLTEGPAQEAENEALMSQIASMSDEELDRDLAEEGIDPAKARRDGVAFVATLFKQREIQGALEAARIGAADAKARDPRATLERKLADLRDVPVLGGALGWFLKRHGVAKLGDGELQAVVDES